MTVMVFRYSTPSAALSSEDEEEDEEERGFEIEDFLDSVAWIPTSFRFVEIPPDDNFDSGAWVPTSF